MSENWSLSTDSVRSGGCGSSCWPTGGAGRVPGEGGGRASMVSSRPRGRGGAGGGGGVQAGQEGEQYGGPRLIRGVPRD